MYNVILKDGIDGPTKNVLVMHSNFRSNFNTTDQNYLANKNSLNLKDIS